MPHLKQGDKQKKVEDCSFTGIRNRIVKILKSKKKLYRFTEKGFAPDTYQQELDGHFNDAIDLAVKYIIETK